MAFSNRVSPHHTPQRRTLSPLTKEPQTSYVSLPSDDPPPRENRIASNGVSPSRKHKTELKKENDALWKALALLAANVGEDLFRGLRVENAMSSIDFDRLTTARHRFILGHDDDDDEADENGASPSHGEHSYETSGRGTPDINSQPRGLRRRLSDALQESSMVRSSLPESNHDWQLSPMAATDRTLSEQNGHSSPLLVDGADPNSPNHLMSTVAPRRNRQ